MSSYTLKTKYNTEGAFGSIEEQTLYAHHNLSCDSVMFHDELGKIIFTVPDTIDNNILDAINRLYAPFKDKNFVEGVESMNEEERKKLGI